MTTYLLRRRKLGLSSVKGIKHYSETGIDFYRNDAPTPRDATAIIRWGCTSLVPNGLPVFNKTAAIGVSNDKSGFRRLCQDRGDNLVPATAFTRRDAITMVEGGPVIVRPMRHAQGRQLYYCTTAREVDSAIQKCGQGFYASEYIRKASEFRVYVVQGRVATVAEKTPGNREDIAWNVARGGRFDVVNWGDWNLQACKKSVEAFNLTGLDFGGVDVMISEDGVPYVIEINSAPSLPNLTNGDFSYRQKCLAKCFDYMVNSPDHIPLGNDLRNWRAFIHPSISNEAA